MGKDHFEFDAGLHYATADFGNPATFFGLLWSLVGDGQVAWAPFGRVFDEFVWDDGTKVPLRAGLRQAQEDLEEAFPTERQAVARFFRLVRWAPVLAVVTSVVDRLGRGRVGQMARSLLTWMELPLSETTTTALFQQLTPNTRLHAALAYSWGDLGVLL
jgi:hypothetical protein